MWLRGKALCVSIGAMFAAMAVCLPAPAQDASDKCKVEGSVLNSLTGQPVRKARLSIVSPGGGEAVAVSTDSQGKFAFANLAPGAYMLSANHPGFLPQNYGAKKPGGEQKGTPLELTA